MTTYELKNKLQAIADQRKNTIEKKVAIEALYHDDIKIFFSDLLQFGCVSGMINSLMNTHNSHAFFDTHYYQIEELREEYEDSLGESLSIKNDLKTYLAWFAFEQTAYNMINEFELEL